MCFSAEADFVAAAVLAPIGVLTIRATKSPLQLPIASLPLVFAAHQFIEGFVWLGTDGGHVSSGVTSFSIYVYLAMAQMVLPILVPAAMYLIEPEQRRRKWHALCLLIGIGVAAKFGWILTEYGARAYPADHTMVYKTPVEMGLIASLGYFIATCTPSLISKAKYLFAFGVANVIGVAIAAIVAFEAITSVWCVYSAFASILVLVHLRSEKTPPGSPRGARTTPHPLADAAGEPLAS